MKILGFLLVVVTGMSIGWNTKQSQSKRIRSLEWCERFLECAAQRIRFSALPIAELLKDLSFMEEFSQFSLLQAASNSEDFRASWQCELKYFAKEFSLSVREKELFSDFMNGFGKTDIVGEVHHCEQYHLLVHQCIEDVRIQVKQKGNLYLTLGFCCGGLIGLLFL